jgi:hypothetical protein
MLAKLTVWVPLANAVASGMSETVGFKLSV